jgi:hypothetical protein
MSIAKKRSWMESGLLVLALSVVAAPTAARSEPGVGWPKGLAEFQKPANNCPKDMPAPPSPSPGTPELSAEYRAFQREQACRTNALRIALESKPASLCPGMQPSEFLLCYERVGSAMAAAKLLDLSSLKFLASAPLGHFLADRQHSTLPLEGVLQNMRLRWVNLKLLEKRTTPDKLGLKDAREAASLTRGEKPLVKTYAKEQLAEWEKLLKAADSLLDEPNSAKVINSKNRVVVARQEFKRASKIWNKY